MCSCFRDGIGNTDMQYWNMDGQYWKMQEITLPMCFEERRCWKDIFAVSLCVVTTVLYIDTEGSRMFLMSQLQYRDR